MNRNRIIRLLQSVLCVLLAVLLAAAAIGICREGLARKASDPLSPVFTPAAVGAALRRLLEQEVGRVFAHVLEDCGGFPATPAGEAAFGRYAESLAKYLK